MRDRFSEGLPCPLMRANAAQCAFLLQGASDKLYSPLNICQRKIASGKEILRPRQAKRIISLGTNWIEMWLWLGSDPVHACLQSVSQLTGQQLSVPQFTHLSDQNRNSICFSPFYKSQLQLCLSLWPHLFPAPIQHFPSYRSADTDLVHLW